MEDEEVEVPLDAVVSFPRDSDGSFPSYGLKFFEPWTKHKNHLLSVSLVQLT